MNLSLSSLSQSAATVTFGLAEMWTRSSHPLPPTPTDASRSVTLAPYTRDQLAPPRAAAAGADWWWNPGRARGGGRGGSEGRVVEEPAAGEGRRAHGVHGVWGAVAGRVKARLYPQGAAASTADRPSRGSECSRKPLVRSHTNPKRARGQTSNP